MSGLVGALLVTLLVIGGFVGFRALNRNELDVRPEPIELTEAVLTGQEASAKPVYPDPMPQGWTATSFDTGTVEERAWGLGLHTEDGSFAGIRRERASLEDLLDTYVDESADEGDTIRLDSELADSWQTWTDEGGDTAYAAQLEEEWLLVYGSAPAADLRLLAESLTDREVTAPGAAP